MLRCTTLEGEQERASLMERARRNSVGKGREASKESESNPDLGPESRMMLGSDGSACRIHEGTGRESSFAYVVIHATDALSILHYSLRRRSALIRMSAPGRCVKPRWISVPKPTQNEKEERLLLLRDTDLWS